MHGGYDDNVSSPQLVWTYQRQAGAAYVHTASEKFEQTNYRDLIHPKDWQNLINEIRVCLKLQRRHSQLTGYFVNVHRVKDAQEKYRKHLSMITLACDENRRLRFVFGVNYIASAQISSNQKNLQQTALEMQKPISIQPDAKCAAVPQQPLSLLESATKSRRKSDQLSDPFNEVWRCAGFIISPSLFRMIRQDDGHLVELSQKQARFIALLLGSQDDEGIPFYVEREKTRRHIFSDDPNSKLYDNDIDRMVKFVRQQLGHASIGTKRGYGHILRATRFVCEREDLLRAAICPR